MDVVILVDLYFYIDLTVIFNMNFLMRFEEIMKLFCWQGVSPRDNGGWTCRVTATVAGKTQVSADIVRLFVGKSTP